MAKLLQRDSMRMLALALAFYLFFDATKHAAGLARVNPFAEDPFDAVGSFAVQFAFMVALLSAMRAFRRHSQEPDAAVQRLVARGNLLCVAAVILTLLGDSVALARHMAMWRHVAEGRELLMLTCAFWIGTCVILWLWSRTVQRLRLVTTWSAHWTTYAGTLAVFLFVLAIYPEQLRQTLPGALLTVVVGMVLLFAPLRVFARIIPTEPQEADADALDEIFRLCGMLASKLFPLHKPSDPDEIVHPAAAFARRSARWLRRNRWAFAIAVGAVIGAALAQRELADGHVPVRLRQLLTIGAVFVGLQSTAVLLGAALLSRPLRLLRERPLEPEGNAKRAA